MQRIRIIICAICLLITLGVSARRQEVNIEDSLLAMNARGELNLDQQMLLSEWEVHKSCVLFRERKLARAYVTYVEAMKIYPLGLMQMPPAAQLMSLLYYWWLTVPVILLLWWAAIMIQLRRDGKRSQILGVTNKSYYRETWQQKVVDVLNTRQRRHDTKMLWPFYLVVCFAVTLGFFLFLCGPALGGLWPIWCFLIGLVVIVCGMLPQRNVKDFFNNDFRHHVLTDLAENAMDDVIYCPVKSDRANLFFQNSLLHTIPRATCRMAFEFNVRIDDMRTARLWEASLRREFSFMGNHLLWWGEHMFEGMVMSITMPEGFLGNTMIYGDAFHLASGIENYLLTDLEGRDEIPHHHIYTTEKEEAYRLMDSGVMQKIMHLEEDLELLGYKRSTPEPMCIVIACGKTLRIFLPSRTHLLEFNRRHPLYIYNVMEQTEVVNTLTAFIRSV